MMRILIGLFVLVSLATAAVVDKWHKSEDGTTYFIEDGQRFNWFEAWNECARKDMSLITIDSQEKHQQIDKLIRKLFPVCPSLWLAANDHAIDKHFEWVTNGQPVIFSNWAASQPNPGNNGEHCVFILEKSWEWHDVTCTAKSGFICEVNTVLKKKEHELEEMKKCCQNQPNMLAKYNSIVFNRR